MFSRPTSLSAALILVLALADSAHAEESCWDTGECFRVARWRRRTPLRRVPFFLHGHVSARLRIWFSHLMSCRLYSINGICFPGGEDAALMACISAKCSPEDIVGSHFFCEEMCVPPLPKVSVSLTLIFLPAANRTIIEFVRDLVWYHVVLCCSNYVLVSKVRPRQSDAASQYCERSIWVYCG